ncbi:hypothetical protein C2G38_2031454 [Gigaspora rosea]|uniref:Uncharacterized protein n=1 Tax=Gigaspora rosea TaxID=44941 RepID=A0A397VR24_9GLOM|nr:hypothetical protein C2G38_2031454 [Gigaspora rosea]
MDKKLNEFLTINKNLKDFFVVNAANEESEHSDEISSDFVMNKEVMNSEFEIESYDDMLSQNEIKLLSGKQLTHGMNLILIIIHWTEAELYLKMKSNLLPKC